MDGQRSWRPVIWGAAALLLLLPLAAMQLTQEVVWDAADFAVFGTMLVVACGAYELATRLATTRKTRIACGVAILATFLIIWAELAVGIFD